MEFTILMVYKTINGLTPPYMSNLLNLYRNQFYTLRSEPNNEIAHKHDSKTEYIKKSFSVCGMKYWNSIPFNIRSISNITSFKRNLKSYLLTVNDFL